jgi:hypothetical protein
LTDGADRFASGPSHGRTHRGWFTLTVSRAPRSPYMRPRSSGSSRVALTASSDEHREYVTQNDRRYSCAVPPFARRLPADSRSYLPPTWCTCCAVLLSHSYPPPAYCLCLGFVPRCLYRTSFLIHLLPFEKSSHTRSFRLEKSGPAYIYTQYLCITVFTHFHQLL